MREARPLFHNDVLDMILWMLSASVTKPLLDNVCAPQCMRTPMYIHVLSAACSHGRILLASFIIVGNRDINSGTSGPRRFPANDPRSPSNEILRYRMKYTASNFETNGSITYYSYSISIISFRGHFRCQCPILCICLYLCEKGLIQDKMICFNIQRITLKNVNILLINR